ncbi:hypothetical protein ACF0H5_005503 [Mactra antiquata]
MAIEKLADCNDLAMVLYWNLHHFHFVYESSIIVQEVASSCGLLLQDQANCKN